MLNRINELVDLKVDFAFETTLSTRSYASLIKKVKLKGYTIVLIYFWLESVDLVIERVKNRVRKGRHSIPKEVIKKDDIIEDYQIKVISCRCRIIGWFGTIPKANPSIVAESNESGAVSVYNYEIWQVIKKQNK